MNYMSRRRLLQNSAAVGGALVFLGSEAASHTDRLRIALFKAAGNLDPQRYVGVWGVQSLVFDPLIQYGPGGKLLPGLAESWTFSKDFRLITFNLRPNVTFSDGTPWNAEAMQWNLNRWIGNNRNGWLGVSSNFDKLVVINPMRVELHLKAPVPAALSQLTIVRPVRFLSPKSVAADGTYKDPIGTGPWKVEESTNALTVLSRNEKYWGPKPAIRRLELPIIPDARSRIAALRAGDVDICGGPFVSPISPQEAATLKSAGINVVAAPGNNTFILGFNPDREILKDARVRHAVNLCIDRAAIASRLLNGFATPTMNLFPESLPNSGRRIPVPPRDVARARTLLEQAGWTGSGVRSKDGKPLSLELVISEEAAPGSKAVGEVLQSQLQEAGFGVRLRAVDHATRHDDIPARKYDIALFVTNGPPHDPHASLISLFLSTYPGGTDGKIYMDTQLDPLINDAVSSGDETRAAAYQRVYDWMQENHAIAPIFHGARIWAHRAQVKGFSVPPTDYEIPFEGITVTA